MSERATVRVAVVGAGHWGPNLIRNFHEGLGSEVAWVVDRDAGRLAQVSERFPRIRVSEHFEDAFADDDVDAVVVATPTATHFPIARAALEAGRHVMVEKPIATTSEDAGALCDLAEERGLVLMVGHVFLFNAGVRRVKEYLDEGTLGRLHYVSMVRTNLGPIRMDVNAAWDLAAHDVSIANDWLGAQALAASAVGGSWVNPGVEDAVFATLRYPGDVLVHLHTSWLHPNKTRLISVVGERRMLTLDDMSLSEPIRVYDKYVSEERRSVEYADTFASFRASVREGDVTIPKVALGEPLRVECDHFLDCVRERRASVADGRAGAAVVRVLEALDRSIAAGGREEPVAS